MRPAGDARGDRRDIALVDDRLAGDVETDRDHWRSAHAAESAKDDARRLRIVPDVELGRGRDIARLRISAAHDDEALDEARQFGLAHDGERDVCQRPHRAKNEAPGMRARRADDQIRRMRRMPLLVGRWQDSMAKPGLAVDFACVPDRIGDRRRRARPDGDIRPSRQRENRPGVARRGAQAKRCRPRSRRRGSALASGRRRRGGRRRRRCRCRRR